MKNKITVVIALTYAFFTFVCAQGVARNSQHWTVGGSLTGNAYFGDINYKSNYFNVLPGVEVSLHEQTNKWFSPQISAGYSRIIAQNPNLEPVVYFGPISDPNSKFFPPRYVRTEFIYGDLAFRVQPLGSSTSRFRPYASAGIGGMIFFPFKNDTLPAKGLNTIRGEKFSTLTGSLPLSLGTDIRLGENVNLNLGTALRLPMNDYMDLYGAKLVPNRKKAGDMIVSFNVGAHFNLSNEKTPTAPKIYIPPMPDPLPMDTTILASNDPAAIRLLLNQTGDFLAAKDYTLGGYPEGWIPLMVLTQSMSCDSIAELADQRIRSLYNENLQLRSQYKKIELELQSYLNNPQTVASSGNSDSLIRVIYNKENKIKQLEDIIASQTPDAPHESLGASQKVAEYEKEIIALQKEIESLKTGAPAGATQDAGYTELRENFSKLEMQKKQVEEEYATLQAENEKVRQQLVDLQSGNASAESNLSGVIDSLIKENERLVEEFQNLKKEYLTLQSQYNDLSIASKDVPALQASLQEIQAQNASNEQKVAQLTAENEQLKGQNLGEIKTQLEQAAINADSMNTRYTRLQKVIENYEALLAASKTENDGLVAEVARLNAMVASSGSPIDSVRYVSMIAEIEEAKSALVTEQKQRRQAEADVEIANQRLKELEAGSTPPNINSQELEIARARIEVLEAEKKELAGRVSASGNDTAALSTIELVKYKEENEMLRRDKDELVTKAEELRRKLDILEQSPDNQMITELQNEMDVVKRERANLETLTGNYKSENEMLRGQVDSLRTLASSTPMSAGIDSVKAGALLTQLTGLQREKDSLAAVIVAIQNESPDDQVASLQRETELLQAENAELKRILESNKEGFAPIRAEMDDLKNQIATLAAEKSTLASEKRALEQELEVKQGSVSCEELAMQAKQLDAENTLMRQQLAKSAAIHSEIVETKDLLVQKDIEIENLNKKLSDLVVNTDAQEVIAIKDEEILQLNNERTALTVEKEKLIQDLAVARALNETATSNPADKDRIADLEMQVEKLKKDNQDILASVQPSTPDNALTAELERLKTENEDLKKASPDVAAYTEKIIKLEADLAAAKASTNPNQDAALSDAIRQKDSLNAVIAAIINESSDEQVVMLQRENTALQMQNTKLASQVEELKGIASNPNAPAVADSDLQEKITNLTKENQTLREQKEAADSQLAALLNPNDSKDALLQELGLQVSQLTAENDQLRSDLKSNVAASGGNGDDKDEEILSLRNQGLVLVEERDRWKQMYEEAAKSQPSQAGNSDNPSVSHSDAEEEILALKNQLYAVSEERTRLVEQIKNAGNATVDGAELARLREDNDKMAARISQLESLPTSPSGDNAAAIIAELKAENDDMRNRLDVIVKEGDKGEEIAALMAEKLALQEKVTLLEKQAPATSGTADENLIRENNDLRARLSAIEAGAIPNNDELFAVQSERDNLRTERDNLREQLVQVNSELIAAKSLVTPDKEDIFALNVQVENFRARIQEQQKEITSLNGQITELKSASPQPPVGVAAGDEIAVLMQEKLQLTEDIKALTEENETLRRIPSGSGDSQNTIAELRGRILALEEINRTLQEKAAYTPEGVFTKQEELNSLRNQNQEVLGQNDQLRAALANALEELNNQPSPATTSNPDFEAIRVENATLIAEKSELYKKVAELNDQLAASQVNPNMDILAKQNSDLISENESLKADIARLRNMPPAPTVDASAEVEMLRSQNSDLNNDVMTLNAKVKQLEADLYTAQTTGVTVNTNSEIPRLETEIATLKNQIEKDGQYVSEAVAQREADSQRIAQLERDLEDARRQVSINPAASSTAAAELAELQGKFNDLRNENAVLANRLKAAEAKEATAFVPNTNGDGGEIARKAAEVAARERRVAQREEYIELKEEELSLANAKVKASDAREVELRMLEQNLKGFWENNSEVMQDGAPCFPVNAFLSKDDVAARINDYFSALGYKYQIVGGKMVYKNVLIPEIDKTKPVNVALYMMISSENNNKRVLQGSFQFAGDKTYITSEKYPTQSIRAIKVLQKLGQ